MRQFKVIVIGDSNVGKTCLTFRFCEGRFPSNAVATVGVDFREKKIDVDGEQIVLHFWDTAGQERFRKSMVQQYYRKVDAIVFVYDMTRTASFQSLRAWILECEEHGLDETIPRILVGNKCDEAEKITVCTSVAQQFAHKHNMPFFETSALSNSEYDHIETIFMTLASKLCDSRLMAQTEDDSGLSASDKELYRTETTVALLESGLVDVVTGDVIPEHDYWPERSGACC